MDTCRGSNQALPISNMSADARFSTYTCAIPLRATSTSMLRSDKYGRREISRNRTSASLNRGLACPGANDKPKLRIAAYSIDDMKQVRKYTGTQCSHRHERISSHLSWRTRTQTDLICAPQSLPRRASVAGRNGGYRVHGQRPAVALRELGTERCDAPDRRPGAYSAAVSSPGSIPRQPAGRHGCRIHDIAKQHPAFPEGTSAR